MSAIENEKIYGLKIRESANDGSDFGTPDADYRFLFLGEDGRLHVKDSADAVTDPGATAIPTSLWQSYLYPVGAVANAAPTNAEALPSSGGSIAIPFTLPGPMKLKNVLIHNRDTASARAAEWRLFYDDGSSTAVAVTGADGTWSFTPSAASDRSSTASGSPVILLPGAYWLVIRNTSGAQTFGLGYVSAAGTFFNADMLTKTKTLASALTTTLDFSSGWSDGARLYAAKLRGSTFGS